MSVKKFRFVSPGIFINEIDNSQLPKTPEDIGPVVIGRTERGPGMRPVRVSSFSDFVETFGSPIAGGQGGDIWRDGNYTTPTYAGYAAQAWLKNATPCTVVRLLGTHHDDRTSTGDAGWYTTKAFGLFIAPYDGSDTQADTNNAALAAVIYTSADIGLVGNQADGSTPLASNSGANAFSTGAWCVSQGDKYEFKINIDGVNKVFNFNRNSKKFIRNALNTNPTLTNSNTTSSPESYFIGETYERHLEDLVGTSNAKAASIACLIPLAGGASNAFDKNQMNIEAQQPTTSWIFSQHTGAPGDHKISMTTGQYTSGVNKLFKFHGLSDGAWSSRNLKLSIADVKAGDDFDPYGTFTVVLRKTDDSDNAPTFVERFTGCNLNPNSASYISKKIGDMYTTWDYAESRYRTYGQYINLSKFIRVEVAADVEAAGLDASLLPFGFYGPAVPRAVKCASDNATALSALVVAGSTASASAVAATMPTAAEELDDDQTDTTGSPWYKTGSSNPQINLIWPAMPARSSSASGNLSSGKQAYFGATSNKTGGLLEDKAYADLVKPYSEGHTTGAIVLNGSSGVDAFPAIQSGGRFSGDQFETVAADLEDSGDVYGVGIVPAFTLDDLVMTDVGTTAGGDAKKSTQHVDWLPGARSKGASITARGNDSTDYFTDGSTASTAEDSGDYKDVIEHGFDQFTVPLFGGTDGFNVMDKEPFSNRILSGKTALNCYAYNSIKRAIDAVSDPEVVEMNLATIPGLTNAGLTSHLINTCENRADALAIIDLENDYVPSHENTNAESARIPDVDQAVTALKTRAISSSYGCAYFPWVQIRDTVGDATLWAPPSIVALGTMASSQRKTELWFAPAGFNRGGLTEGSAGIPVTQARLRLTSKDRDKLYEANINPIATFPSEGLVIFGQKTLQVTPSALDRINVRRLLIFLKKEVSRVAATILFDNNVRATWNRFTGKVEPLLASVKSRFGLSEFRVILDETTTTPDLVDRNILYAKVLLKPAKAIEFIAIDFVITNSGASFED